MRVLVVEDDEGIATGLRGHLAQHGHVVEVATRAAEAWSALCDGHFDMLLLDLGLPDGDGSQLLDRLRRGATGQRPDPQTPVLVMTARDEVSERIRNLDLGADDFVGKPFDPEELAARMRALHRRHSGRAQPTLQCGALSIDPAAHTVLRDGHPVELSAREFAILLALVEARPRVLSRRQIEDRLYAWGGSLESNAIEVHVHRLRRKVGDDAIRTLRGVGYFVPLDDQG